MLWLVDSAHLLTRVNNLFALPKQASYNPRNIFLICESWCSMPIRLIFREKTVIFLKRPRAWNYWQISKIQEANKILICWEYVCKISAKNNNLCVSYSKLKSGQLSWTTLYTSGYRSTGDQPRGDALFHATATTVIESHLAEIDRLDTVQTDI